jgi:hypothetical protein
MNLFTASLVVFSLLVAIQSAYTLYLMQGLATTPGPGSEWQDRPHPKPGPYPKLWLQEQSRLEKKRSEAERR